MFHLDTLATLVAATLTLLLGRKLVHSVSFFEKIHHTGTCCGWFISGAGAADTEKKHGLGSQL